MENKAKLTYTDKVKDGVLKLTEMEIGTAITGVITQTGIAKFGPTVTLKTNNGNNVLIYLAGSAKKFYEGDAAVGKYDIGNRLTLVRKEDYKLGNGFMVSQFVVSSTRPDGTKISINGSSSKQNTKSAGLSKREEIEAKLRAQRS